VITRAVMAVLNLANPQGLGSQLDSARHITIHLESGWRSS